jgi:hypothetical protein
MDVRDTSKWLKKYSVSSGKDSKKWDSKLSPIKKTKMISLYFYELPHKHYSLIINQFTKNILFPYN